LANSPRLILADEPTGELDSKTGREMLLLFQNIVREKNVTMLMASHDSLVDEYVDQVLHLRDGEIVTAAEYAAEHDDENKTTVVICFPIIHGLFIRSCRVDNSFGFVKLSFLQSCKSFVKIGLYGFLGECKNRYQQDDN
jgi:energy-coupling factor transporter ATP-binding protein EcfA2